ncbi:hypothetical protein HZA99_05700 [Candidatus Woesearchaeota archaeon]|nr:hypothetical protein [Candidatus Woesearchaeota archaeon]
MNKAEEMVSFTNYFIFDNDWDWYKKHIEQYGSNEEKEQDIPLLEKMKENYRNSLEKKEERVSFKDESDETKRKQTISGEESNYSLLLSAIENGMCIVVEDNNDINDFELMTSLKKLKQNIEFGTRDLDRSGVIVKTLLGMPLSAEPRTRHEVALCLQYFIKIIREQRQEFGKHAFVIQLKERSREMMLDDDNESEEIYFNFIEKETLEQYYFLMSISDPDEYEWADIEFHNVGVSLMKDGKWKETEQLYQKQLKLYSEEFMSYEDYGMFLWRTQMFEEAEKYMIIALQKAEEERNEYPDSLDEEALDYIQKNLNKIKKREECKEDENEKLQDLNVQ